MRYRIADFSASLDILFQNSYAVFCFIKRGLNRALRPGKHYRGHYQAP